MRKPVIALITPAAAAADNGNGQTARRWARMLAGDHEVRPAQDWDGTPADLMIALHARRSAPSIARWAAERPRRPLAVVLTGTDLYRGLAAEPMAQRSLELADRLIVQHEGASDDLPPPQRAKAVVCFPSTLSRRALPKTKRHLRALMVGHLRDEKDPRTYFAAARKLADREDILLDHVGAPLDERLGGEAQSLMEDHPNYRWLGALPHAATLARIQRAHVLVHPGAGAHAVMLAVRSGTPVLASKTAGNVGLLGRDYRGYFAPGDAGGLAVLLQRVRGDRTMLQALRTQCDRRAALFEPAREQATLRALVASLLETPR